MDVLQVRTGSISGTVVQQTMKQATCAVNASMDISNVTVGSDYPPHWPDSCVFMIRIALKVPSLQ